MHVDLPSEYVPYARLVVCGNVFEHGVVPIEYRGKFIFLVGKGPVPLVWLNALVQGSPEWAPVVKANHSLHWKISVQQGLPSGTVVEADGRTIVEASSTGPDACEIRKLNLRAVGLDIVGDSNGLSVGGSVFKGNRFSSVRTMLSLGEPGRHRSP